MFITKVIVENFCGFKNKVILDLNQDKNSIQTELNHGYFRMIHNKVFTPVIGISGANATGKTTLLEAICLPKTLLNFNAESFVFLYDFNDVCRSWLDNVLLNLDQTGSKEENYDCSKNSEEIASNSYLFEFTKIMPFALEAVQFLNFFKNHNDEEFKNILKKILEHLKRINELINEDDVYELVKQVNSYFLNQKQKIWSSLKRNKTKPTTIKIEFYDPHFGEFSFIVSDSLNIQKENPPFSLDVISKRKKVNYHELWQKIIEYFQECFSPFDFNKRKSLNKADLVASEKIESNLIEILRTIGLERTTEILKIVDPSIESINYGSFWEKFTSVSSFNNDDGSVTPIRYLSSGTKRFVYIVNVILRIINKSKNCDGFIAIDELESYLHVSLRKSFMD